jgi:DNA repair protein RecN (Recombination protein N)
MLQQLYIKDFALIDEMRVDMHPGLNILTGETGAGKSIVIDSINLILGDRANIDLIRSTKDKAIIEAVFDLKDVPLALEKLNYIGIEADQTLVIFREISGVGRNICRINGRTVTQSILKDVAETLLDLHGQHEHQSLLNPDKHIDFLDQFGGKDIIQILTAVETTYKKYKEASSKLKDLSDKRKDMLSKLEFLKFQQQELAVANLSELESDQLEKQKMVLANAEKIFTSVTTAYAAINDTNELQMSALDGIGTAVNAVRQVENFDEKLKEISELLDNIICLVEDVARELRDYIDTLEFSAERLNEIEERLDLINRLKRKYGCTNVKELIEILNKIENEIEQLSDLEYSVEAIEKQKVKIQENLIDQCKKLSSYRKKAALYLEEAIAKELKDLAMDKTQFKVNIDMTHSDTGVPVENNIVTVTARGFDKVEFLISTNPGEPLKPLSKIVSGGELSRIMLAIKSVLAKTDNIPTMVFDEIDTGISGRTAQMVAEKLSSISKNRQIICVTHLPQIACMADRHFYLEKKFGNTETVTYIKELDSNDKITELARMLGGAQLTETTKKHAKEMLNMAFKIKQNCLRA